MDQRFQLISHHRDDKHTEPPRALNPVINNSKSNKIYMIYAYRSILPYECNKSPEQVLFCLSNQVGTVILYGVPIVSLQMDNQERLCLAQISNTLLHRFSYNEIHNRRVALGITCVQCTPVQLEMLRRAGAMPVSSRRCGMITRREAERLCNSFLGDNTPPRLPEDFAFAVHHECAWGCRGSFLPSRYNSSRAKCIRCSVCGLFFSPNKFIFHSHRTGAGARYVQPDAANFNSWRRHMKLSDDPPDHVVHAWEDVKAMFNGGTRKRAVSRPSPPSSLLQQQQPPPLQQPPLLQQPAAVQVQSSPSSSPSSSSAMQVVQMPQPLLQQQSATTVHLHQRSLRSPELQKKQAPVPAAAVQVPSNMPLHQAMVDYVQWQQRANPFAVAAAAAAAYSAGGGLPCWLPKLDLDPHHHHHSALVNRSAVAAVAADYSSAFRPVYPVTVAAAAAAAVAAAATVTDDDDDGGGGCGPDDVDNMDDMDDDDDDDDEIDIETCPDER
ncbi:Putative DNA-binding domain,SAND domain-like,c-SKI SMAD4-binding domain,Transforming protein Ski [Cinara cedri]|uniref:DNA-binding domain,SAND domain-like,c-SKI SMAD4-binding domain,Transforming protein Ski n=1 Tax=Cinara cedri TaxID=506608 RepID=A0A5E4M922_9HEMI|nr:Putative DNA-binding domain,SAND domain-like,c-SKI SMAD4-binding domain,Transforming protein Ski [Cinara cedri]